MRWLAVLSLIGCVGRGGPAAGTNTSGSVTATSGDPSASSTAESSHEDLSSLLRPIRNDRGLPALTAVVVSGDAVLAMGTVGDRQEGGGQKAEDTDLWHLGSCTKAMTATLAATLVEDGTWTWESTLGSLLDSSGMDPSHLDVSLVELLTHQSGLTGSINGDHSDLWSDLWTDGESSGARTDFVTALLARPPDGERGTYLYSNAGYIVVGAAMEAATGSSWEDLMEKRLFKPLGMDECGFGAPLGDAPWGHQGLAPVDPEEPGSDNPPGLGPAGTVHCSMASWGAFAQLHILGAEHPSGLLSESQVAALHTPVDGYALGWGVLDNQPWAEGPALAHDGSNTMWYATIWVAPGVQRAYLVATNAAPASAGLATSEVVGVLVAEDF